MPNAPEQLWDVAYLRVKGKKADLVDAFESVLLRVDLDDVATLKDAQPGSADAQRLEKAVQRGLEKTQRWASALETTSMVVTALQGVSDIIRTALSSAIPQAGAAWMGVSILLKGLGNATDQALMSREGVIYVGSQVRWYRELFFIRDSLTGSGLVGLRSELEAKMTDLFEEITVYQMRSVISFYKNQLGVAFRNSFGIRDWGEALKVIRDSEQEIRKCLEEYHREAELEQLARLTKTTEAMKDKIISQLDEMLKRQDAVSMAREKGEQKKDMAYAHKLIGKFKVEGLHYEEFMDRNPPPAEGTCGWFLDDQRLLDW